MFSSPVERSETDEPRLARIGDCPEETGLQPDVGDPAQGQARDVPQSSLHPWAPLFSTLQRFLVQRKRAPEFPHRIKVRTGDLGGEQATGTVILPSHRSQ